MPTARASTTEFDVDLRAAFPGRWSTAPMVITNAVNVYGNALGTNIIGSEGVPTGSTGGSSVTVIKAKRQRVPG